MTFLRTVTRKAIDHVRGGAADLVDRDPLLLVLRVTLLFVLFKPFGGPWGYRLVSQSLAAWGLLSHRAARSLLLWLGLTGVAVLTLSWSSDNHMYLVAYWFGTILCGLAIGAPRRTLVVNARWLLVLVFAFAVVWKGLLSPDYRDGTFFLSTLLLDGRFEEFVVLVTGLSEGTLVHNQSLFNDLRAGAVAGDAVYLTASPGIDRLAIVMTWGVLLLEASVAVAYALPRRTRLYRYRHVPLFVFCWGTYAIAPVAGFGWILAILGLAQCRRSERIGRLLYLATLFIVFAHSVIPWLEWVV